MAQALKKQEKQKVWTPEEFLAFDRAAPEGEKYEFLDGKIVPWNGDWQSMAGASTSHNRITVTCLAYCIHNCAASRANHLEVTIAFKHRVEITFSPMFLWRVNRNFWMENLIPSLTLLWSLKYCRLRRPKKTAPRNFVVISVSPRCATTF